MDNLKIEEDKLDQEQEVSYGEYEKMRTVFEKRIPLYKRYLKKEELSELDRLRIENKKEWAVLSFQLDKFSAALPFLIL